MRVDSNTIVDWNKIIQDWLTLLYNILLVSDSVDIYFTYDNLCSLFLKCRFYRFVSDLKLYYILSCCHKNVFT